MVLLQQPTLTKTGTARLPVMSTHCSYLPPPSGATENKCSPFYVATEETQFLSHFCGHHTCCRVRERRGTRESLWPSWRAGKAAQAILISARAHVWGATEQAGTQGDPGEAVGTQDSSAPLLLEGALGTSPGGWAPFSG